MGRSLRLFLWLTPLTDRDYPEIPNKISESDSQVFSFEWFTFKILCVCRHTYTCQLNEYVQWTCLTKQVNEISSKNALLKHQAWLPGWTHHAADAMRTLSHVPGAGGFERREGGAGPGASVGFGHCLGGFWVFGPRMSDGFGALFSRKNMGISSTIFWVVVWLPFFIFPYIGNVIIPVDELIFFRTGWPWPTNQFWSVVVVMLAIASKDSDHLTGCCWERVGTYSHAIWK